MSDKKFKIRPTTWPKEYTFEEFKQLNPNINENILINYYNKYLQEYAEDRSRHVSHFNDTKDNLSKELLTLKESTGKFGENVDGDGNVGPTGGGRKFRSPLEGTRHSLQFDHVDDHLSYIDPTGSPTGQRGITPGQGTLRPTEQVTVSAWVHLWNGNLADGDFGNKIDNIISWRDYNDGTELRFNYRRIFWSISGDDGDGTKTELTCETHNQIFINETKAGYRAAHPGWVHVVGTFDGRYAKLYTQGILSTAKNESATGNEANATKDGGENLVGLTYARATTLATHGSSSMCGPVTIGALQRVTGFPDVQTNSLFSLFSGSIGEVAVWDKALDADAILDIYSGSMSPSSPNFDLSYSGYNNGENNHDHPYDFNDEGVSYKNTGPYAKNLQGWWRMNEGSGTIAHDSSGKGRHMTINNSPTWDGTLGTSGSYYYPGIEL